MLVPEPRVGGRGRVTQVTADPGKGGDPHLRPCLTHSPQPTSASRPAPLPTQHGPTPSSKNGAAPRWPGPTPCLLASEEETWEQRRSAVRQPACARGRRQRLPPRTAWTAAPRVSAKPPGAGWARGGWARGGRPAVGLCSSRPPETGCGEALGTASLFTWLFLTQPLKSGLHRQRSTVGA